MGEGVLYSAEVTVIEHNKGRQAAGAAAVRLGRLGEWGERTLKRKWKPMMMEAGSSLFSASELDPGTQLKI